eukprot:5031508-Amphidinium_carterae.1
MDIERDRRDPLMVYERPPPKVSYRKRRSMTRDEEEEEIDALTMYSDHQGVQGPRAGLRINQKYDLLKNTLEYITHLPGDTSEDAKRMEQILVLDDDMQSIDDEEYYRREPGDTQDLVMLQRNERRTRGNEKLITCDY